MVGPKKNHNIKEKKTNSSINPLNLSTLLSTLLRQPEHVCPIPKKQNKNNQDIRSHGRQTNSYFGAHEQRNYPMIRADLLGLLQEHERELPAVLLEILDQLGSCRTHHMQPQLKQTNSHNRLICL